MRPTLLAIRALAVEFIMRLYSPVTIVFAVAAAGLVGFTYWLTTLHELWWALFIFMVVIVLGVAAFLGIMWVVVKKITPVRTKGQKMQARLLVDKMQRLTEVATLPKFFLWFQIARDVIHPKQEGFIASVSSDSSTLHQDFMALRDSFEK